jgi:hypothetical protein
MRLITGANTEHVVHFYWDRMPGREVCTATIHEGPCIVREHRCINVLAGAGSVRRFVKDLFIKSVARREALTKALRASGLPRPLRTRIWQEYYRISRVPKARRA